MIKKIINAAETYLHNNKLAISHSMHRKYNQGAVFLSGIFSIIYFF